MYNSLNNHLPITPTSLTPANEPTKEAKRHYSTFTSFDRCSDHLLEIGAQYTPNTDNIKYSWQKNDDIRRKSE